MARPESCESATGRELRILHLEDDPRDAELVAMRLQEGGIRHTTVRVETKADFERETSSSEYDLILSDYTLPEYDGDSALAFAHHCRPEVPFILVSGTVGEDAAVHGLLAGAADYVLKDRPDRLVPAVRRALRDAENARARKRAEAALLASEQRYRRLFEASKDGILLLDAVTGAILDANPSVVELLGHPREALLGMTVDEVGICGKDPASVAAFRELAFATSGHYPDVRVSSARGRPVDLEFVWSAHTVDARRVIQLNMRDITERRHLEEELRHSQKLEAIGRLAGGVSHDFNNLLVVINDYTELALESLGENHSLRPDLEEILKAGQRAAKLTSQLLAFSRKQLVSPVYCSVNTIVAEIEKMLRRVIGENVELRLNLERDLGTVLADPGQIEQVLMNLVVNSRDAMQKGGTIVVETANAEIPPDAARTLPDVIPGSYVSLSVSDSGCGMDDATLERLFEPFFTTKAVGKGTGLGLSTLYGIVKQSGGHIEVESRVGTGTMIRVYFPRKEGRTITTSDSKSPGEARARVKATILLVEDEVNVRVLVERILAREGYRVLAAGTASEALMLAECHNDPIHLLITDVVLPHRNGCELALALADLRPTMKVVYMSGYTAEVMSHYGLSEAGVTLIQKPFTVAAFLSQVQAALDAEPTPTAG